MKQSFHAIKGPITPSLQIAFPHSLQLLLHLLQLLDLPLLQLPLLLQRVNSPILFLDQTRDNKSLILPPVSIRQSGKSFKQNLESDIQV